MQNKAIEIPFTLQRGDIWFYLELALIDDVPALYKLLKTMGISPQFAYMRTPQGIEILLLLAHEHREVLETSPDDFYWEEQQLLANAINTEAIHCRSGFTRKPEAIAA